MKKILSLDGGGIRGIIPGQILIELETALQQKTKNPDARIVDFFDFFAGTSTGGILTAILLCPSDTDPTRPKFSATEAVELYINNGAKIFYTDLVHDIEDGAGTLGPKYKADGIEACLKQYLGDIKLNQLLKPCIITAYDIQNRETKFFAQQDYALLGDKANFYVRDVCRATSAAPTYFPTELITSISGQSYACVDGGVFANNPSLCAYSEVRNAVGSPVSADMFVVSIGTGSQQKPYPYNKAKNWGELGWVKPVIDIMMSGAAEVTDYHMQKLFSANGHQANYNRIQPSSLGNADPEMDDATAANVVALRQVGTQTAKTCTALDRIIQTLLDDLGKDSVTFV